MSRRHLFVLDPGGHWKAGWHDTICRPSKINGFGSRNPANVTKAGQKGGGCNNQARCLLWLGPRISPRWDLKGPVVKRGVARVGNRLVVEDARERRVDDNMEGVCLFNGEEGFVVNGQLRSCSFYIGQVKLKASSFNRWLVIWTRLPVTILCLPW